MKLSVLSFCVLLSAGAAVAQPISSKQIDSLTELTLKTFDVPGIAVGVVKDGKLIHAKGYGVRSLVTKQKTDENTLFGVASNSKAFTAAALGMLIDEGKLTWDDKVTDIIPGFKLYSPYVTEEFTVLDLLCHRSGLGLGAGDLMFWPDSSNFTKQDIIHNLRYLKPVSSFRTKYDYDNLLYMVAGEVVAKISGLSWEDFIESRIMKPLAMTASAASLSRLKNNSNIIDGHAPVNGKITAIPKDWSETVNAAGGIYSNVTDLSKWIITQMNNGKYGENLGQQLFSETVHDEMWTPQTIIPVRNPGAYNTHFSSYGLGWALSDVAGYKQCTHTGGLAGTVTQIVLLPELKLGIIVLTNQQVGAAFNAISTTIKDSYLGITGKNRVKEYHDRVLKNEADAKKITNDVWTEIEKQQKAATVKPNLAQFTGTFTDNWLGDAEVSQKGSQLWLASKRSPRLRGELLFYNANTFVVKWQDRSFDADAFLLFDLDSAGKASGFTMKTISPLTDFSFDFQDLDFKRVEK
jgi:CubicO group peptidase (beta-lactamase class C family)